ncbi:MAG TPA: hypothetical protein VFB63_13925 [Bryobacteraceae bacterium]|jgi:hypothetical protein|nr:hypothetical protein [Bryobacteraceae bacterium]
MYSAITKTLSFLSQAVSYALAGVLILFFLGGITTTHLASPPNVREWLGIGLITVACFAPVLARRHELGASALSLVSVGGFCLLTNFSKLPIAAVLALPGGLHLLHALAERSRHTMANGRLERHA